MSQFQLCAMEVSLNGRDKRVVLRDLYFKIGSPVARGGF